MSMMKFCAACRSWTSRDTASCKRCGASLLLTTDVTEEELINMSEDEKRERVNRLIYQNGQKVKYKGSVSGIWHDFFNVICYIIFVMNILIGAAAGVMLGGVFEERLIWILVVIGTLAGFISGFLTISLAKLLLVAYKNIETMTDNTAMLLEKMDEVIQRQK